MTDATTTPTDKAGEPVAWRIRRHYEETGFGRPQVWTTDDASEGDLKQWRRNGYEVTPLYTYPQPSLSVGLDREVRERLQAAVDDADAGGRYDHCKDDGTRVEIDTEDLRSLLALSAPAEGYVLVPVEPTEAMGEAGRKAGALIYSARANDVYRAMIAARPAAPTGASKS